MRSFPDNEAVLKHLEDYRVPAAPVMDPVDAIDDPYFKSRDMVKHIVDPVLGPLTIPGFPLKFSDQPEILDLQAPTLGEHNEKIMTDFLNYDVKTVKQLIKDGILFSKDV